MEDAVVQSMPEYLQWVGEPTTLYALDLFRGVPQADYRLIPSIGRNVDLSIPGVRDETPRDVAGFHLSQMEGHVVDTLRAEAPPYLDLVPESYLDWVVLAQHHGASTRLLDWTRSCLVALYFAVEKHTDSDGAVYLIRALPNTPYEGSPLFRTIYMTPGGEYVLNEHNPFIAFVPRHISARIAVQLSVFTWHWDTYEGRPFTEGDLKGQYPDTALEKAIIPTDMKDRFRVQLSRMGFSHKTLFPGLTGICRGLGGPVPERWRSSLPGKLPSGTDAAPPKENGTEQIDGEERS
ncbi:MAG: hypothetical protein A3K19_12420 [Lentisphaerae bacterium RIFOXYB12_FULL_65_16]|nr:MAG: hypothetical protein A3K18_11705 [Lentisphaerae bacterium RIFOXYA12_64_32]OGV84403.1 MAG: hypothetical protein A3K19_12420 [Lentisphaerae bacterium RIFOXYB12_FULL_65_16]